MSVRVCLISKDCFAFMTEILIGSCIMSFTNRANEYTAPSAPNISSHFRETARILKNYSSLGHGKYRCVGF